MPLARLADVSIYYEVHGTGEPLVLIMGLGGSSALWLRQVPVFSRQYRVVTFDNRGTGQSDKPDISYTMEIMAGDLAGVLDAIGIHTAHVFGVSMGGMVAQHFVLLHPGRVNSLILGCTTCGGPISAIPDIETISLLFDMERWRALPLEERAREMLPFLLSQDFIDNNPSLIQHLIAIMKEHSTPLHGYTRQAEAIMRHDTYERLAEIKAPTLVIAGDADKLVPIENSRILASRIAKAELVILKNMGHGFNIEAADETNKFILDFIRRHSHSI
jgi:3-oxoadipate enol-lactonase